MYVRIFNITSQLFLICLLLTTASFAQIRCKLRVSAIDAQKNTAIQTAEFTLVDHSGLKATKMRAKNEMWVEFEYPESDKFSLKATGDGFQTSVVMVPNNCGNPSEEVKIQLYLGKSKTEIFLAGANSGTNSNGRIVFDSDRVFVVGQSWPKPSYSARCAKECEVTVGVEIDDTGNATTAKALTGNPNLRKSAEAAALRSKFKPVYYNGKFVFYNAVMRYVFN